MLSGGAESCKGKREAESSRTRWCQAGQEETKPRANNETRVTMSTPEEQMAAAVQQLNVRPQQQGTMATILQAERDDLAKQVQSATSTTTQRQPGDVDTRVIGRRSDEVRGMVVQTENKPWSRGPAVSARTDDDRSIVNTQTQRDAQQ